VFAPTEFGRAPEVRLLLEPWSGKKGVPTIRHNNEFAVPVDITVGEDKDQVIRAIVDRLKEIGAVLSELKGKTVGPE
jgi:ACT domain-containing protein